MKLTRGSEYGIRGILYLAQHSNIRVSMLSAIAASQDIPPLFLAKIFQALAKAGLVKSHRGAKGGFSLARPAKEITVKDVIEAVEGPIDLTRDQMSPGHVVWMEAQRKMTDVLSRANFADLAAAGEAAQLTAA